MGLGITNRFITDLYERGLREETSAMIVTDSGEGLLAAIPNVYPKIPIQRCWAHNPVCSRYPGGPEGHRSVCPQMGAELP